MNGEAGSELSKTGQDSPKTPKSELNDSVAQFIQKLPTLVKPEDSQRFLRATPKGVFVEQTFLTTLLQKYIDWFHKEVSSEASLSPLKVSKRFFRIPNPPLYYLVESKPIILGHLLRREIKDPQRSGLPHYFGSPDDARTTFNPRDPIAEELGVEVIQGRDGREFSLAVRGRTVRFGERTLKEFSRIGRRLDRRDREATFRSAALRDALQALAEAIQSSHPASKDKPLLIPVNKNSAGNTFLLYGALTFVCSPNGFVTACYDLGGQALFRFVKGQLIDIHRHGGRGKGFELMGPRSRHIAIIRSKNTEFGVGAKAFEQFIRNALHRPIEGPKFRGWYSVADCLEEFSDLFKQSSLIDKHKISHQLPRINFRGARFWVSRRWLFITNNRQLITHCVDLYSNNRSPNRSRNRSRYTQRS